MRRAVGQARRAVEALVAVLNGERTEPKVQFHLNAALRKLAQLSELWEGATEQNGVLITRHATEVHTNLSSMSAALLAHPTEPFPAQLSTGWLRDFIGRANRMFPGN